MQLMEKLAQFIEQQRQRVSDLEAELARARAKLEGMEEIFLAVQSTKIDFRTTPLEVLVPLESGRLVFRHAKKRRALSPAWKSILGSIGVCGTISLDLLAESYPDISRKLFRNQLAYYIKQDLVGRNKTTGDFYLTDEGYDAAGLTKGEALSADNTEGFDFQPLPEQAKS